MPTYSYRCSSCRTQRDHFQKMSDEPLKECPECGGEYKRIITSVGVIFKGSGFHINDYKGPSGGGKPAPEKGSESKPESSSDSKPAEAKPSEAKPDSSKSQGKVA